MKNKITIKDIAKELNIHHATVSRALRNDVRISEKTRKMILEFARTKGYEVNQHAVNFRNSVSNEIAIIVPNISHFTFSNLISRMSDLAQSHGFVVSVFQSKESLAREQEIIQTIIRNRVAGVIASISKETIDGTHFRKLQQFGIPLVFFDRSCTDVEASKVSTDNYEAAIQAVQYLVNKGYRRVAHLSGPSHINVFSERQLGYKEALNRNGLAYECEIIINKEFEFVDGENAMLQLLSVDNKPDAIFCDSFVLSAGVLTECSRQGVKIPDDMALITIANDPFSALVHPPQTILEQPLDEIAASAIDLMMQQITSQGKAAVEVKYHQVRLVERNSV